MIFTSEQEAFILIAHFRSGKRNPDGTWTYSLQSSFEQFKEKYPEANVTLDNFRYRRNAVLKSFKEKNCICKTVCPGGRGSVLTDERLSDIKRRIEENPKISLKQLAVDTGLSKGTCFKATKLLFNGTWKKRKNKNEDILQTQAKLKLNMKFITSNKTC